MTDLDTTLARLRNNVDFIKSMQAIHDEWTVTDDPDGSAIVDPVGDWIAVIHKMDNQYNHRVLAQLFATAPAMFIDLALALEQVFLEIDGMSEDLGSVIGFMKVMSNGSNKNSAKVLSLISKMAELGFSEEEES